ncbi:MAG: hypothetical protein LUE64_00335, partial [Candidatus Gastranaerophilales bacterium]|nr:hypothetical protein [Candidatus Gastranaerophilales bacterium]
EQFISYGAGFGHGVGMSQYGAGFLSKYNIPYNKILEHYYTGIKLGTMPKTVSYNSLGTDYVQEFYFTKQKTKLENISKSPLKDELKEFSEKNKKPKCYLTIENPNGVSDVEFYINGYYFNQNMGIFKKKILKTEITAYLDEGKNKIIFKPLLEGNKKKALRFYITLGDENE